ncbi:hypothetical protein [Maribacter sp. 2308TA10-17]|uniref:hypothetical protein n=1 Tax=Maribacter sp. 2308TA10-17 TaxID=3386276 RepID=UPI0039BC33E3
MRFSKFIVFITSILLFANCDEKELISEISMEQEKPDTLMPTEITYFTYKVGEFEDTSTTDNWLIIHDQSGKLLDYRSYEQNDLLEFTAIDTTLANSQNLVVTTLKVGNTDNFQTHSLNTFTEVEKNFSWNNNTGKSGSYSNSSIHAIYPDNLNVPKVRPNSKSSLHNIIVNDIPSISRYTINSSDTGVVSTNTNLIEGGTLTLNDQVLLAGASYIFFIADTQGEIKHLFFEIDENTTDLVFNYGDFTDFEHVVETNLAPSLNLISVSRGFENPDHQGRGYEMSFEINFDNPTVSKIGYVSGYQSYYSFFSARFENFYSYRYLEKSTVPLEEINILEKPSFVIENDKIDRFSFNTDIDFVRTKSSWKYDKNLTDGGYQSTYWTVYNTNKSSQVLGDLPEEILAYYPKLELDKIQLIDMYLVIRGATQNTLISNLSNPVNAIEPDIIETIIIYPDNN